MRWRVHRIERDLTLWNTHFVWWPQEVDDHIVWLEFVWRRWCPGYLHAEGHWNYSLRTVYV
jgi:hypothetical protein